MQDRSDGRILFELGIKETSGADIKRQANEIAKTLKEVNELAIKMTDIYPSNLSESRTKYGEGFARAFVKGFSEGFKGEQTEIENLLKGLRESIVVGVKEKVGGPGGEALVQKFNDSLRDGFKSKVQDTLTESIKGLNTVSAFSEVQNQVKDVINDSFKTIETSMDSLLNSSEDALKQFSDNFSSTWKDIESETSQPPSGGAGGGTPGGGGGDDAARAAEEAAERWQAFRLIQEYVIANSERLRVSDEKLSHDGVEGREKLLDVEQKHLDQLEIANGLMDDANDSQAISIEDLKKLTFARNMLSPILDQNISGHRDLQNLQRKGAQDEKADFNDRVNTQKVLELEISKGAKAAEDFQTRYSGYRATLKDDEKAFALALRETNAEFATQKDHAEQVEAVLRKIREKKDKADEFLIGIAHDQDGGAILDMLGSVKDISDEYDDHGKSLKQMKVDLDNINAQYGIMTQQVSTARKVVAATNRDEKEKADQLKEHIDLGHKLAMLDAKAVRMQNTIHGEKALLAKQDELHGGINTGIMETRTRQWEKLIERANEFRDIASDKTGFFDTKGVEDYNRQIQLAEEQFKHWLRARQDLQKEDSLDRRLAKNKQVAKDAQAIKDSQEAVRDHQKKMLEEEGQSIKELDAEWERLKSTGIETGRAWELAMKRIRKSGQTGGELVSKMASNYSKEFEKLEKRMKEMGATQAELTRAKNEYAKGMVKAIAGGGLFSKPYGSLRKFNKEIEKLERKGIPTVQAIEQAGARTGRYFGDWEKALSKVLINVGAIRTVISTFGDFIIEPIVENSRRAFGLAENAAKLRDAEVGFKRLAGAMRESSGEAINVNQALVAIRQAAGGAIDEFTLMSAATRAALAGISPKATKDAKFGFDDLVTSARALAAVTGREAAESVDRLTNAIAKQERRLLDELGIVVRAEDLYKDYARSHDLVSDAMTAEEKVAAFLEGTIERVNEKVAALGGIVDTAQGPMIQLRAEFRNMKLNIGELIRTNEFFRSSVRDVTNILADLGDSFQTSESRIAGLDEASADLRAELKELYKTLDDGVDDEGNVEQSRVSRLVELFKSMSEMYDEGIPDKLKFKQAKTEFESLMATMRHEWPQLQSMLMTTGVGGDEFEKNMKKWSDKVRSSAAILQEELGRNTKRARKATADELLLSIQDATETKNKMSRREALHSGSTAGIEGFSNDPSLGTRGFQAEAGAIRTQAGLKSGGIGPLDNIRPGGKPWLVAEKIRADLGDEESRRLIGQVGRADFMADKEFLETTFNEQMDSLKEKRKIFAGHIRNVLGEEMVQLIRLQPDIYHELIEEFTVDNNKNPFTGKAALVFEEAKKKLADTFGADTLESLFTPFVETDTPAINAVKKQQGQLKDRIETFADEWFISDKNRKDVRAKLDEEVKYWDELLVYLKKNPLEINPVFEELDKMFLVDKTTGDSASGLVTEAEVASTMTPEEISQHMRNVVGLTGGKASGRGAEKTVASLTQELRVETAQLNRLGKDLADEMIKRHEAHPVWNANNENSIHKTAREMMETGAASYRELKRLEAIGQGEGSTAKNLVGVIKSLSETLGVTDEAFEAFDVQTKNVEEATKKLVKFELTKFNRAYKDLLETEIKEKEITQKLEEEIAERGLLESLATKHKNHKEISKKIAELQTANANDERKAQEARDEKDKRERESRERKALKKAQDELKAQQDLLKDQLGVDLATLSGEMDISEVIRGQREIAMRETFKQSMANLTVGLPEHMRTTDPFTRSSIARGGADALGIESGAKDAEKNLLRAQARLNVLEKKFTKQQTQNAITAERRTHKDRLEEIKKNNNLTLEEKISDSREEIDFHEAFTDEMISDLEKRHSITGAEYTKHHDRLTNTIRDGQQDIKDIETDGGEERLQIISDLNKSIESINGIGNLRRLNELRSAHEEEMAELIRHSEDTVAITQKSEDLKLAIRKQTLHLIDETIREQQQETSDLKQVGGSQAGLRIRNIGRKGVTSRRDKFSDLINQATALGMDDSVIQLLSRELEYQGGLTGQSFNRAEAATRTSMIENPGNQRVRGEAARTVSTPQDAALSRELATVLWLDTDEEGQNFTKFLELITTLRENHVENEKKTASEISDAKTKASQEIDKDVIAHYSFLRLTGKAQRDLAHEVAKEEKKASIDVLTVKLENHKKLLQSIETTDKTEKDIIAGRIEEVDDAINSLNTVNVDKDMDLIKKFDEATLAVNRFGQVANQLAPIIGDIFGKADFAQTVGTFVSAAESGTKAVAAFATGNPIAGVMATLETAGTIYNFLKMKKEEEEQFKRDMRDLWKDTQSELTSLAAGTGKEMAGAIVDNMDMDMDKLIQQFVKSNIAEEIATVMTEGIKEPIGKLKDTIRADFADEGNIAELAKNAIDPIVDVLEKQLGDDRGLNPKKVRQVLLNQYPELAGDMIAEKKWVSTGKSVQQVTKWIQGLTPELEKTLSLLGDEVSGQSRNFGQGPSELQQIVQAAELQRLTIAKGGGVAAMAELTKDGNQLETQMTSVMERLKQAGIIKDDATAGKVTEGVPTATFRAVTEPQANQMLLVMTQQVNHLHAIETNTSVLPTIARRLDRGSSADPFAQDRMM